MYFNRLKRNFQFSGFFCPFYGRNRDRDAEQDIQVFTPGEKTKAADW